MFGAGDLNYPVHAAVNNSHLRRIHSSLLSLVKFVDADFHLKCLGGLYIAS